MTVDVAANLGAVEAGIARAAGKAGRNPAEVLLVAVSKSVEPERIGQAIAAGVKALGENRVQEAKAKVARLGRPVPWHLVGTLQTNKAKDAVQLFDLIHSLDRVELGRELDRRARAAGKVMDVLVQVNVAGEATKAGFPPDRLKDAMEGKNIMLTTKQKTEQNEYLKYLQRKAAELTAFAKSKGIEKFLKLNIENPTPEQTAIRAMMHHFNTRLSVLIMTNDLRMD